MKNSRTEKLCKMICGDTDTIVNALYSENKYVRMDGILWSTYYHFDSSEIVSRLKELKSDESLRMGYTVGNYAVAALDNLGIEPYNGTDEFQIELNKNFFLLLEDVKKKLYKSEKGIS